jgi:quercetin dioxygenase-like cupin family protein
MLLCQSLSLIKFNSYLKIIMKLLNVIFQVSALSAGANAFTVSPSIAHSAATATNTRLNAVMGFDSLDREQSAQGAKDAFGKTLGDIGVEYDESFDVSVPNGIPAEQIIAFKFGPNKVVKPHLHDETTMNFVTEGSITIEADGISKEFQKGSCFFVEKETKYSLEAGSEGANMMCIYGNRCRF